MQELESVSQWLIVSFPTEPVSVPQLRFLSAPNASCSGGNVSISCESISGSLPIQYQWYRKTQSGASSVISHSNKLDIQCGSISQSHQCYCTASNNKGTRQSEMVEVSGLQFLNETCRYLVRINSIGEYSVEQRIQEKQIMSIQTGFSG